MDETFSDIKDRSKLPARHEADTYVTERTLIRAALSQFGGFPVPDNAAILDIGAGDGRWGLIAREVFGAKHATLVGVDIRDRPKPAGFSVWYPNQDFVTWGDPLDPFPSFDLIVSNPPFYCAEPIIRRAWKALKPNGRMVMLLRSDFMNSVGRYDGLWTEIYPRKVGTLVRRPSFYGGGKTNRTPYCVFYWEKCEDGRPFGEPREWPTFLLLHERESKAEREK